MTADKNFKRLVRQRACRTGESYASARRELLRKRSEQPMTTVEATGADDEALVEVDVAGITTDEATNTPRLDLADTVGGRRLAIFIGPAEATAIASALQQVAHSRPMTHDALKEIVDALGGRVVRIVIGFQPEASTFTADVVLSLPGGDERHLDWRVSDSVALAVRCLPRPPILVPTSMLDAPPASVIKGIQVRCVCGHRIVIDADMLESPTAVGGLAEADVECPACGIRRHLRIQVPPGSEKP